MKFTTKVPIAKAENSISYTSKVFSVGSCFAVNIAQKLSYFQFQNTVNPFGILFHPLAIQKALGFANSKKLFSENELVFHDERWHSLDAHSDMSSPDLKAMLQQMDKATEVTERQLQAASHIIITLGTAWVYRHKKSGAFVANCHKIPQREFDKELLSADTVAQSVYNIINLVKRANPLASIIFTISPVRHLKDGFAGNQRSKASLVAGLHQVLATRQKDVHYFPSYEIMMDELRDYRFYNSDMVHPNEVAIDYIWERFAEAWITGNAANTMLEVEGIRKGLLHKPFNAGSSSHKDFVNALQLRILALKQQYPHLDF